MIFRPSMLVALPAALGGIAAAAGGGLLLWPQWQQLQQQRSRMVELRQLEAQLPLMDQQLARELLAAAKADAQQALVLQLIAGSGSLATFLAELDRLADGSGVKLSLFEPLAVMAAPQRPGGSKPAGEQAPPPPPADPLLARGLAKREALIGATGPYPSLLAFMRQLEKLNVLVVQSNLQLALEAEKAAEPPAKGRRQTAPVVQLKMGVATYHRSPD